MPRDGLVGVKSFAAVMRELAHSLRAVHGRGAQARALTIAEAVAIQGNDEVADFWVGVARILGHEAECLDRVAMP